MSRELGAFRVARLFDGRDEAGQWTFAAERARMPEGEERRRVVRFLRSGMLILRVNGRTADALDPAREYAVGMSTHFDGRWIWSDGVAYYLDRYGIAPDPEFLSHIAACGYEPDRPEEPVWREALALMMRPRDER